MKNLILTSALVLGGVFAAQAQDFKTQNADLSPIKQGNWMVGGSVGSLGYSFEGKQFNINLNPRAGYFISDGVAVGISTGFGYAATKDRDNEWNYNLSPFVRYYIPEGSSTQGRFFGEGEIGVTGASNSKSDTSFAFGLGLGYSHFITQSVALEAKVGYNYSKSNKADASAQSGLGLAVGFQIFLPGSGAKKS